MAGARPAGAAMPLPEALEEQLDALEELIAEGDALEEKIRVARRSGRKTSARLRRSETRQERALSELHTDCMHQAKMNKHDERVATLFEGGFNRVIKPALATQNEGVRAMIGGIAKQSIYEGPLRDEHVPKLQSSVDDADRLLKQRVEGAQDLSALYADALQWKRRGDTLRAAIGALLITLAVERGEPSPKDWARGFFGRGQE